MMMKIPIPIVIHAIIPMTINAGSDLCKQENYNKCSFKIARKDIWTKDYLMSCTTWALLCLFKPGFGM